MSETPYVVPDVVPNVVPSGFNWGAFWLTWLWGIGHGIWIALLLLIVGIFTSLVSLGTAVFAPNTSWITFSIIMLINLSIGLWFGFKGNYWAWNRRGQRDLAAFTHREKVWSVLGWILGIIVWSAFIVSFIDNQNKAQVTCAPGVSLTVGGVEQCPVTNTAPVSPLTTEVAEVTYSRTTIGSTKKVDLDVPTGWTAGNPTNDALTSRTLFSQDGAATFELIVTKDYAALENSTPKVTTLFGSYSYLTFPATTGNGFGKNISSSTAYAVAHQDANDLDVVLVLTPLVNESVRNHILSSVVIGANSLPTSTPTASVSSPTTSSTTTKKTASTAKTTTPTTSTATSSTTTSTASTDSTTTPDSASTTCQQTLTSAYGLISPLNYGSTVNMSRDTTYQFTFSSMNMANDVTFSVALANSDLLHPETTQPASYSSFSATQPAEYNAALVTRTGVQQGTHGTFIRTGGDLDNRVLYYMNYTLKPCTKVNVTVDLSGVGTDLDYLYFNTQTGTSNSGQMYGDF